MKLSKETSVKRTTATTTIVTAIAAALLAACASAPQRSEQLEEARARVNALRQDPMVNEAAGRDLETARTALDQADQALQAKKDPSLVSHLAYVANRHAEVGLMHIAEARARARVAQAEAERNKVLLDARTRDADNATLAARAAQAAAAAQQAQADQARQDALKAQQDLENLQKEYSDLQAKQTERGMVLTLGDVLFDTGQATLKPGATLVIDRLAKFLTENKDTRVIIEGHTDSRGADDYNMGLSQRRAQAVAEQLQTRGITTDRIQAVGRGKGFPVASNDTPAGRQQNRRVEIVFSNEKGTFAPGANAGPS